MVAVGSLSTRNTTTIPLPPPIPFLRPLFFRSLNPVFRNLSSPFLRFFPLSPSQSHPPRGGLATEPANIYRRPSFAHPPFSPFFKPPRDKSSPRKGDGLSDFNGTGRMVRTRYWAACIATQTQLCSFPSFLLCFLPSFLSPPPLVPLACFSFAFTFLDYGSILRIEIHSRDRVFR